MLKKNFSLHRLERTNARHGNEPANANVARRKRLARSPPSSPPKPTPSFPSLTCPIPTASSLSLLQPHSCLPAPSFTPTFCPPAHFVSLSCFQAVILVQGKIYRGIRYLSHIFGEMFSWRVYGTAKAKMGREKAFIYNGKCGCALSQNMYFFQVSYNWSKYFR
ncbi:hypothetical protein AVEN_227870-1 [Araneus ventricosus]|uniref:Uncharacterized protein n=1 Tax=Araneus ventricosus TaxID=182803 RepID=A0A4Y2UZ66_ARAVE|nr:hypothetical protein AVEN_227870-1 [Araneus ventricosus]